ncbi:MAG: EipB family protein [Alphaproteobacteria bacterium]
MKTFRTAALIFVLACAFASQAHAVSDLMTQAGFVPHKALYEIRLSSKKSSATVSNISGKMLYEWHAGCDGWVSAHQFDMLYDYIEIPPVRITSDFSTYESFDSKTFNFSVQRKKDGYPFEEIRGVARLPQEEDSGKITYTLPAGLEQELPGSALFPTAHTLDVFNKIKEGKRFYIATLFDGSDSEGPVELNTFIGDAFEYDVKEQQAIKAAMPEEKEHIDPSLLNTKAWNIRLAFFPEPSDIMADYEMSLVFHENSVISSMEIEYEDFSVVQDLVAVQRVESGCDAVREKKKNSWE